MNLAEMNTTMNKCSSRLHNLAECEFTANRLCETAKDDKCRLEYLHEKMEQPGTGRSVEMASVTKDMLDFVSKQDALTTTIQRGEKKIEENIESLRQ